MLAAGARAEGWEGGGFGWYPFEQGGEIVVGVRARRWEVVGETVETKRVREVCLMVVVVESGGQCLAIGSESYGEAGDEAGDPICELLGKA